MRRLVFAMGAWSLAAQALLFRELMVVMHGDELGAGLFFATWLGWVGVGAWLASRLSLNARTQAATAPLATGAQLLALAFLPALVGIDPAQVIPLSRTLLVVLPLAPTSLITGMVFAKASERASGLYAWEAAGSFVGGAGFTLALTLGLSPLAAMGPFALALALTARPALLPAVLGLALMLGGTPAQRALARAQLRTLLPAAHLLDTRDTPRGRLVVARLDTDTVILQDGRVVATLPDAHDAGIEAALLMAQLPASGALRVGVLGEGAFALSRALAAFPDVTEVDLVGPDEGFRAVVDPHLPAPLPGRVHRVQADPRTWLSTQRGTLDAVVVATGDPTTIAANRLHTAEFYRLARAALRPTGVLTTHRLAGANFMGAELKALGGSALATLESVFDDVIVLPGDPARFYAGASGLSVEPSVLARRYAAHAPPDPIPAAAFSSLVDQTRLRFVDRLYRAPSGEALINLDRRPVSTTLALLARGRLSGEGWVQWLERARAAGSWLGWLPLLAAAVLWRRRDRGTPVVGATGLAGMGLGLIAMVAWQEQVGTLFSQVGLLSAVLLGGVAVGASLRWMRPAHALGLTAALALASPAMTGDRWLILLLAALAGVVTGAGFPAAARLTPRPSALFAADHLGGAVGALVIGGVLLPLIGVSHTGALIAGVQLIALGLAWAPRQRAGHRAAAALAWLTLSAVAVGAVASHRLDTPTLQVDAQRLLSLEPELHLTEHAEPFIHTLGEAAGRPTQAFATSAAAGVQPQGYAGPINLLAGVGADGELTHLAVLEQRETPAYLREVLPWLSGLVGTHPPLDVDVVTGATLSSQAVLDTLNASAPALAALAAHRPLPPPPRPRHHWNAGATWLLISFAIGVPLVTRVRPGLRRAWLVLVALIGGVWLNVQLSLDSLAGPLQGHAPGAAVAWVGLGGLVITTLLFGSTWCSTLCPVGATLEWLGRLGPGWRVSRTTDRRARWLKYLLLTGMLTGFALTGRRAWLSWDPLATAFSGPITALIVTAALLSVLWLRAWCRYLCPLGALVSLGNLLPHRWLPRRDYRACDYGVRGGRDIDCLQCHRCAPGGAVGRGPVGPGLTRDPWLLLGLALALLLIGRTVIATHTTEEVPGGARTVDVQQLQQQIDEGELSAHPADFWEPLE